MSKTILVKKNHHETRKIGLNKNHDKHYHPKRFDKKGEARRNKQRMGIEENRVTVCQSKS